MIQLPAWQSLHPALKVLLVWDLGCIAVIGLKMLFDTVLKVTTPDKDTYHLPPFFKDKGDNGEQ